MENILSKPLLKAETDPGNRSINQLSISSYAMNTSYFPNQPTSNPLFQASKLNSQDLKTTEDIFTEISSNVQEHFSKMINIPYKFTDVKFTKDETNVFGVTDEGYCVNLTLTLTQTNFRDILLTKNSLSGILLYKNDTAALVKEKKQGVIYCIEIPSMIIQKVIRIKGEGQNGIGRMCFIDNDTYCLARLWRGEIIRWKVDDMDKYEVMLVDKNVICMNVSPDNVLVLGMHDKRIILYSSNFEEISQKTFEFRVDAFINFSGNGLLIILGMEKGIKILNRETLNIIFQYDIGCQSNDSVITNDQQYIIAPLETGELALLNINSYSKPLKFKVHNSGINKVHLSKDQENIYTFGRDFKLGKIKFPQISGYKTMSQAYASSSTVLSGSSQENLLKMLKSQISNNKSFGQHESFDLLCISESCSMDLVIGGGKDNKIIVWNLKLDQLYGFLKGHEDYIFALECLTDKIVASGSGDSKIKIWNFRDLNLISTLNGHCESVTNLIKLDKWRLVSGSQDKSIKIWFWEEEIQIYSINGLPAPVLSLFVPKSEYLIVGMNKLMQVWELKGYTLMFQQEFNTEISKINLFSSDFEGTFKNYISLGLQDNSVCIENPFLSDSITYLGINKYAEYEFLQYIREIITFKVPHYNSNMDKWVIFPYIVNTLHFYAYFDMPEYLSLAILNGAPLLSTKINENALSIAIEMKHKDCVEAIIKSSWRIFNSNPYLISIPNPSSLITLNSMQIKSLPKLYNLLFPTYKTPYKYCSKIIALPIIKLTSTKLTNIDFILKQDANNNEETEIKFSYSSIPLDLNVGSKNSIKFLNSLIGSGSEDIFTAELLQRLIDYKWNRLKWIMYSECFIFLIFYANLIVFGVLQLQIGIVALLLSFLIAGINLAYFIISLSIDYWAVIVSIRFSLFLLYFIYYTAENYSKWLFLVCVVAASMEGSYYFKLWSRTRRLLYIIIKVVQDVFSFLLLIIFILVALGSVLDIIQSEQDLHTTDLIAQKLYGNDLVEIENSSVSDFIENLFYLFMSFVNPLIMLNILLALCAETYNKSEKASQGENYRELAKIILRLEYLLFFQRNENSVEHLQVCSAVAHHELDRFKKLSKIIKKVKQEQIENKDQILGKFDCLEGKIKNVESLFKTIIEKKNPSSRYGFSKQI
jgi:WD40 repeat protein